MNFLSTSSEPGEALQWIESNLEDAIMAPDEAFDWVFLLKDDDWKLLPGIYKKKSELWREACAYVFVEGPVKESKNILMLALSDKCKSVREQAAETICHHLKEYPEEANFDYNEIQKVKEIILSSENPDKEYVELLNRLISK